MLDMTAETGARRELTVGTGAGLDTADMVLNIGPQHPSTHGVLRLQAGARRRAGRHLPSRSSATCTAARRSCSRCATTGRSSCWPTGTTGCRRSANELGVVLAVERLHGHRGAGARGLAAHRRWPSSTGCSTT